MSEKKATNGDGCALCPQCQEVLDPDGSCGYCQHVHAATDKPTAPESERERLIALIDKASGGYNPMRNAVADAIIADRSPAPITAGASLLCDAGGGDGTFDENDEPALDEAVAWQMWDGVDWMPCSEEDARTSHRQCRALYARPQQAGMEEVLNFLDHIEGAGYGGMADFEIARSYVKEALGVRAPRTLETKRPDDCPNVMGCGWHHVKTEPDIGLHLCSSPGCKYMARALQGRQP